MRRIACFTLPLLLFFFIGCADQATAPELDLTASFAKPSGKPDGEKPGGGDPPGPLKFISIETSNWVLAGAFTCAIEDADQDGVGPAYCWGYNGTYSLGLGGKKRGGTTEPTKPVGGEDFLFSDVQLGQLFACGIKAENSDGTGPIYCWGQNDHGELGDGTTTSRSVPTQVALNKDFFALDLGTFGGCALAGAAGGLGDMYCWGVGGFNPSEPTPVENAPKFRDLATSYATTCGIDSEDAAWCWGANYTGAVGNGETSDTPVDHPVRVVGGHTFQALAMIYDLTCGLTAGSGVDADGNAYSPGELLCWGQAWGTTEWQSLTPKRIDPGAATGDPLTALVPGFCALGSLGKAYCWGPNTFGAVGDGTASGTWDFGVDAPTAVSSPGIFQMMGGKDKHTCGIATDGFAYCWGANESGELGDGTTHDSPLPVKVARQ
jgi:hypothetical protein